MSFVSAAYLLLLPLTALLNRLCPKKQRYLLLLAASLLFYMGWSAPLTLVLLGEISCTYLACLAISRFGRKKGLLALSVVLALMPLVVYKYAAFLGVSLQRLTGWPGSAALRHLQALTLPVGISFYTFQALSCVVDVWRGELPAERNPLRYALYVCFFPQLVAGPIERGKDLLPQLQRLPEVTRADMRAGLRWLLSGYFRKVCLADGLSPLVDRIFALEQPDGLTVALGAVLFGFQIYHDFAGYSEIALGSARLLGIRLTRNFDQPYLSRSVHGFWRRWHITLNSWFRVYVYRPLCGERPSRARRLAAACAVFLLSGLWHGAAWTFVAWGAWHALAYLLESLLPRGKRPPGLFRWGVTFAVVSLGWIFFRAESLGQAGRLLQALVRPWSPGNAFAQLGWSLAEALRLPLLLCALPISRWAEADPQGDDRLHALAVGLLIALAIALCWLDGLQASGQNAFIYFQF